jgi:hypothetical protein
LALGRSILPKLVSKASWKVTRWKRISAAIKLKVVEKTVQERPVNATYWNDGQKDGRQPSSVQLKPHLVKSFKISTDPNFAVKAEDIIPLYLDPPEKVLGVGHCGSADLSKDQDAGG